MPQVKEPGGEPAAELLTWTEVASLFGVDRQTVVVWAKRGRLPSVRTPGGEHRVRAAEIRQVPVRPPHHSRHLAE
jgi:excisionase family DNA binding protein